MRFLRLFFGILFLALCPPLPTYAQTYPTRPIRMIVPFAPGGVTDTVARLLAEGMAAKLQQPVIVDNHPGAGGVTGTDAALKSPADGYTIAYSTSGPLSLNPLLQHSPFDPIKDVAPISLIRTSDVLIVAAPSLPASNFRQFVELAKNHPGKLSAGTPGSGTPAHLSSEMLHTALGLDVVTVPYRGDTPAIMDVMGGNLTVHFASPPSVVEQVKAGKLKVIASLGKTRNPLFPSVPTTVEQGYDQFVATAWSALIAPAGTPAPVIQSLNDAARTTMRQPAFIERMVTLSGTPPTPSTPDELGMFIREEIGHWSTALKTMGLKPQ